MNKAVLANLAAAAAALSAGGCVVATRLVVGEIHPVTVVFLRYAIGAACFLPLLPRLWPAAGITPRDVAVIAMLGALFFAFFPWAFSAALQYTTAPRGALGLATIPIQTLLVAVLFGRERLTATKFTSVALAFAGIAVVFGPAAIAGADADGMRGDGLMLVAALSAALFSVFGRATLARLGPVFVTALAMLFGVVAMAPLAWSDGALEAWPVLTRQCWIALAFLGTFGAAIQFALFNWALRWLPPSRTVIYLSLNPISAMLLAGALLDEPVTAALGIGLALVLAGIAVANLGRSRPASVAAAVQPAAGNR